MPQILRKAGRGGRTEPAGGHAERERQHGHEKKLNAILDDLLAATAVLDAVYEPGRDQRDDALTRDLADHEYRRQDRLELVLPDAPGKAFDHMLNSSFFISLLKFS